MAVEGSSNPVFVGVPHSIQILLVEQVIKEVGVGSIPNLSVEADFLVGLEEEDVVRCLLYKPEVD